MALIKEGSFNNFSVGINDVEKGHQSYLKSIRTISALNEVSRIVDANDFELIKSTDQRGVALKNITLTEGFEGFLQNYSNKKNEVYFVAWAWDLSGETMNLYPGSGATSNDVIIPIQVGNVKEFIGEGVNLFPKRYVKGGIALRIQLWESDEKARNFGKAMSDTADAIQKSSLNSLLSGLSLITGVTGATLTLIKDASIELAKVIGTILQSNGDDYVDFFEGYYPSDKAWVANLEEYKGNSSSITLAKY